jgi:addiction module RelB/DinJ family antitoxin
MLNELQCIYQVDGGCLIMAKDTSISIRLDSKLKEQAESVLEQFGLNMTVVVNMLFHQIVREQAVPLTLSLSPRINALDELYIARTERLIGYVARSAKAVTQDMEHIVAEVESLNV